MLRPPRAPTGPRGASFLVVLLSLGACAPSLRDVRRADHVVYDTEFAEVWNAVIASVVSSYPKLLIEDPLTGKVATAWRLIERATPEPTETKASQTATAGQSPTASGSGGSSASPTGTPGRSLVLPGKYFRLFVDVKGTRPWHVVVRGEAAEYKLGFAEGIPYRRGAADEPAWVQGRIDKVKVAIFERLKSRAVEVKEVAKAARPPVTGPWQALPADVGPLVGDVHEAAARRDARELRALMVEDFTWSPGAEPSADQAIATWSADPTALADLERLLARPCQKEADVVVCTDGPLRAEFRRRDGMYRFVAFTRGD